MVGRRQKSFDEESLKKLSKANSCSTLSFWNLFCSTKWLILSMVVLQVISFLRGARLRQLDDFSLSSNIPLPQGAQVENIGKSNRSRAA